MPTVIENPALKVFERWSAYAKANTDVGNNLSMDMSRVPSSFPYMRMAYMGGPQTSGDLAGDECAITPSFQIESFADGQKKLDKVYSLDSVSHQVMTDMGFRRTYQGLVENIDESIVRLASRYSRVYTGQLLGE